MYPPRPGDAPLDQFTLLDIIRLRHGQGALVEYHHKNYSDMAFQRSQIFERLKTGLLEIAERKYDFSEWFRAVKWAYTLQPLSYKGNLLGIGGRFNIGDIDTKLYPPFPGLYLASDFDTSVNELFGGSSSVYYEKQDPYFNALATKDSATAVKLKGALESVVDLTKQDKLSHFVNLIKDFKISPQVLAEARALKLPPPEVVKSPKQLLKSVLEPNWRQAPMLADIPSNSQIFGQLVFESGIDGILYPSRLTGKECLAIFPTNFKNKESFVQIDSKAPDGSITRLDANTYVSLG